MARWQGLSKRTKSGARIKKHHEKRKRELGRPEAQTIIGEKRVKKIRTRGDNLKLRAFRLEFCNLTDPNTGKAEKVKILDVEMNSANKEFTRKIKKGSYLLFQHNSMLMQHKRKPFLLRRRKDKPYKGRKLVVLPELKRREQPQENQFQKPHQLRKHLLKLLLLRKNLLLRKKNQQRKLLAQRKNQRKRKNRLVFY
ncbi:MAG: 30S ribosomal protein S8e [Candidatus Heimdallarchaeota archaeon]